MKNDKDQSAPATKADVHSLADSVAEFAQNVDARFIAVDRGFDALDAKFTRLDRSIERRFKEVNNGIDESMSILEKVKNRLTDTANDHEHRLRSVERQLGLFA